MDAPSTSEVQLITWMILQFLKDACLLDSAHILEKESTLFFDMNYFETMIMEGKFDDVERYLSGFTQLDDNLQSVNTYFQIRKQKFLEALDRNERELAINILSNEFKIFNQYNESMFSEVSQLLGMDNFRLHRTFRNYGGSTVERHRLMTLIKPLLEENPKLIGKLKFHEEVASQNALLARLLIGDLAPPLRFRAENDVDTGNSATEPLDLRDNIFDQTNPQL